MSYFIKIVELPGMCNEPNVGPAERDGEEASCFRLDPWTSDNLDRHFCKNCNHWEDKNARFGKQEVSTSIPDEQI